MATATSHVFTSLTQQWDTVLSTGLTASVNNAISANALLLTSLLILYVTISGILTMFGRLSIVEWVFGATRCAIIATLLTAAAFNQYIQQPLMTDIPNWIASSLQGGTVTASGAQFDALFNQMGVAIGAIQQQLAWTDIGDAIACSFVNAASLITLMTLFTVWETSRFVIGLLVAVAPFLLGFFLFNATRHFVMGLVSQVVTALVTMVLVGIVAGLAVAADATYMQGITTAPGIGAQIQQLLGAVGFFLFSDLLILAVPAVAVRIGGGAMHRMGLGGPPMRALSNATRSLRQAGERIAQAAERMRK